MSAPAVMTRDDFIAFLETFRSGLAENPNDWENRSLEDFLEAMAAWTRDMDGHDLNAGRTALQEPDWQTFADILNGAKVYE